MTEIKSITESIEYAFGASLMRESKDDLALQYKLRSIVHESAVVAQEGFVSKAVDHVKRNKKKYLGALAVGVVAGGAYANKDKIKQTYDDKFGKKLPELQAELRQVSQDKSLSVEERNKKLKSIADQIRAIKTKVNVKESLSDINEGKVLDHLKRNWKKYALAGAVAGAGAGAYVNKTELKNSYYTKKAQEIANSDLPQAEKDKKLAEISDEFKKLYPDTAKK